MVDHSGILLEYCLKQLILDAGFHQDWETLVGTVSFPQIEEFHYFHKNSVQFEVYLNFLFNKIHLGSITTETT